MRWAEAVNTDTICHRGDVASPHCIPARPDPSLPVGSVN